MRKHPMSHIVIDSWGLAVHHSYDARYPKTLCRTTDQQDSVPGSDVIMKRVLQIAAGVLLAAAVLAGLRVAVQSAGRLEKSANPSIDQRAKVEAEESAFHLVSRISPEELIQRCGKPTQDITYKDANTRILRYRYESDYVNVRGKRESWPIWANFHWMGDRFQLLSVSRPKNSADALLDTDIIGDQSFVYTPLQMLARLPCMNEQPKK